MNRHDGGRTRQKLPIEFRGFKCEVPHLDVHEDRSAAGHLDGRLREMRFPVESRHGFYAAVAAWVVNDSS